MEPSGKTLPLNPSIQNRKVDIVLDPKSLIRTGLAQRVSNLIAATMASGTQFGTGTPPGPENVNCRLYLAEGTTSAGAESTAAAEGTPSAAHLEITYKDPVTGAVKPFEKYGSLHNKIAEIAGGKITFVNRFIDDLPLTPDQQTYFESVLKPLV